MHRPRHDRRQLPREKSQRGVLAYTLLLMLSLLMGFAALAVDSGRLYVLQNELQNAADACALAAAQQLTGTKAAAALGLTAAQVIVNNNWSDFQSKPLIAGTGNGGAHMTLRFAASPMAPDNQWISASSISNAATNYLYARCTIARSDLKNWFIYTRQNKRTTYVMARATAWKVPAASNNCASVPGSCNQIASLVQ